MCGKAVDRKRRVLAIAIGFGGASIGARADTPDDLEAQIEALTKQMQELERKQQTTEQKQAEATSNVVTAGATKGSLRLPGSNTSVTVGGYLKLDAVYSNPSAGAGTSADLFLQPNAIPVGPGAGENEHNQIKFGARVAAVRQIQHADAVGRSPDVHRGRLLLRRRQRKRQQFARSAAAPCVRVAS